MPTSPTRRLVLAALAATAVAGTSGCSTPWGELRVQPLGGDPPPPVPEPGPDELARRSAVSGVSAVVAALDGSAVDAAVAGPLRVALGEQLAALGGSAPSAPSSPASTPSPSTPAGSPTSSVTATAAPVQGPAEGAVAPVVALMTSAAATAREPLADVAGGTARLLACLAAGLDVAAGWASGTPSSSPSGGIASPPASGPTTTSTGSAPAPGSASSPSPSRTPADGAGEQGALVVALAAEEAAEYGYGVLAVRLGGEQRSRAQADLAAHALAVEELREQLLALGADPPGPPPAWALPGPVTDAAGAVALAVRLEAAATDAAADVVAAADRDRRAAAAERVLAAAQRWQRWRSQQPETAPALVALPGLSGR